jgi:hypothetical protein
MKRALEVLNELERDGVIERYALGGAVAALFTSNRSAPAISTSSSFSPPRRIPSRLCPPSTKNFCGGAMKRVTSTSKSEEYPYSSSPSIIR